MEATFNSAVLDDEIIGVGITVEWLDYLKAMYWVRNTEHYLTQAYSVPLGALCCVWNQKFLHQWADLFDLAE